MFHDIKKGWVCCGKIVYDWADFEKIEGCCVGMHSDDVEVAGFWQSKTVQHAETGIVKEQARLKTAADFNLEEEARLAKLKEKKAAEEGPAKAEEKKPPKKNKEGRYICSNKGCKVRNFTDEENEAEENPC